LAWSDDAEQLKRIKSDVGSQLATMECKPRHNTVDVPALFWAGIPGNESDFPAEESFYTYLEQALCFFVEETNYRDSPSPFGIKMVDRITGKPLHLDISDEPMKRGVICNRNRIVISGSGGGKSFFVNHLVRQYYEQGTHVVLVDVGNSYKGLCALINHRTGGQDGIYFTYTEDNPISFNPFFSDDNIYDVEKRESIKTLILTLWKRDNEPPRRSEEVALSNAVSLYIQQIQNRDDLRPSFDTFYEFIDKEYRGLLERKRVREKDFDIENFLNVLEPYYKGGEYDYLLNSEQNIDLLNKRFIVFELDNIKDHPILLPVTTLIIMECFISKMRRLQGVRKLIVIEECWKALTSASMSQYIKYLFKTIRKFFGEILVVTQEIDDIVSSPIVKEAIINNSDTKILLDMRKYMNKFDAIQNLLGLTDKEKSQILSINLANDPKRKYKEVWIGMGGVQSAVYATEVSAAEYYTYTTEEREKMELFTLTDKLDGDIELAIKQLAENKNTNLKIKIMFKSKKKRAIESAIEHLSATLRHAAESLAAVADDVRVSRAEIRRDYICGGWTTPDLNRGLIISKLPEGFNAAIYAPPLNRKRTRLLRVFVRVDGDMLKACYDGVEHTITTNPLHDSITFPGYGTFLRDDQIFG
jgi:conjugation system TraG family ATPase